MAVVRWTGKGTRTRKVGHAQALFAQDVEERSATPEVEAAARMARIRLVRQAIRCAQEDVAQAHRQATTVQDAVLDGAVERATTALADLLLSYEAAFPVGY